MQAGCRLPQKRFVKFGRHFKDTNMNELALNKPRVLPPKGLLIALAAQLPIAISGMSLRPSVVEMIAGAAFVIAGVVLNVWAERLFRHHGVGVCPFTHVPVLVL